MRQRLWHRKASLLPCKVQEQEEEQGKECSSSRRSLMEDSTARKSQWARGAGIIMAAQRGGGASRGRGSKAVHI